MPGGRLKSNYNKGGTPQLSPKNGEAKRREGDNQREEGTNPVPGVGGRGQLTQAYQQGQALPGRKQRGNPLARRARRKENKQKRRAAGGGSHRELRPPADQKGALSAPPRNASHGGRKTDGRRPSATRTAKRAQGKAPGLGAQGMTTGLERAGARKPPKEQA